MEVGTLLGLGALVVSGVGAWNSSRKTRIDDRTGTFAALQALNETYRKEIVRLEEKLDATEEECKSQIKVIEEKTAAAIALAKSHETTILEQANRISNLERRAKGGTRTRSEDKDE